MSLKTKRPLPKWERPLRTKVADPALLPAAACSPTCSSASCNSRLFNLDRRTKDGAEEGRANTLDPETFYPLRKHRNQCPRVSRLLSEPEYALRKHLRLTDLT